MNPKKNQRRYRFSFSIHALDSPICRFTHSLASSTLLCSHGCHLYSALLTDCLQYSATLTPNPLVLCSTHSYASSSSTLVFSQTCSSTLLDSQPCLLPVFCCTHSHASSTLPYSKSISNLMMYSQPCFQYSEQGSGGRKETTVSLSIPPSNRSPLPRQSTTTTCLFPPLVFLSVF